MEKEPTASQKQPEAVKPQGEWRIRSDLAPDGVPALWKVGDLILDQYEVTGKLGEGGMGAVYKIHDRQLSVDMAVKSPRPEIFTRADGKENFIREAETWMKLRGHPHLVRCFYVRTLGGIPRIFAEYVDGGSLADWIRQRTLYEGGADVALARILDVAIQFAWGLHAAHEQGLVHQDIKPANVMLTAQGIAKVTDFGIAKARALAGEATLERSEGEQNPLVSWAGMTPAYCSPEQAAHQPLSRKTDIWSWGLSVLQMFVGKVTWLAGVAAREALASHVREDLAIPMMPPDVVRLLSRCFQQQPEARPATMLEVATELQAIYTRLIGSPYPREAPQQASEEAGELTNRGYSLYQLGKPEEALAVYEQALRLDPAFAIAHHNRGIALKQLGRLEEALAAYEQAIRLDPTLASTYNEKGLVLKQLGRLEEALAAYEQAIRLDPTLAFASNNKGNVLLQRGQPQQALVAFEQAIRCAPTYAIAHYSKGLALLQLDRPEEALSSLERAISLNPALAAAHLNKGRALLLLGRAPEAGSAFEQALHLDMALAPTIEKIGDSYRQAVQAASIYESQGHALMEQRRFEEALVAFEQSLHSAPALAVYCSKALVLLHLGRPEEALAACEQALRLDPTFAVAHCSKALVLAEIGKPEEAQAACEQALRLDPTYAIAHHRKALILGQLGRREETLAAFEEALRLDPTLARVHYDKARALAELGRREEALAAFEQALRLDPTFAQYWRMILR